MKAWKWKGALLAFLLAGWPAVLSAQSAARSKFEGKIVTLRKFLAGSHLVLDKQRNSTSTTTCAWTLCAQILIRDIHVKNEKLLIRGERQLLVPDDSTKKFYDLVAYFSGASGIPHPPGWKPIA